MSTKIAGERPAPPATPAPRSTSELRPLSLRKNFAWTLSGTTVYGLCQFAMLSVIAKLGDPALVGRFGLALAITAPVVMFTRLQLRNIQATDARDEYRFSDYLSLRALSTLVGLGLIALIALVARYPRADTLAILALALARASEGVSEVIYGLLQKWERLDLQARSLMLKGPSSLLALGVLVHLTHNVAWGALGMLFAWTALMLAYDVPNARRLMGYRGIVDHFSLGSLWSGRMAVLRRLAWLALPMGVVAMLDSLNTNVPRYVIKGHMDNAALGYFTAMSVIPVYGNMVVASLAVSASPRLSRQYITDVRAFSRLVWRLVQFGMVLGGSVVGVGLLFGRPMLAILYEPDYARYVHVFLWLMGAAALGYIARFLVYSMTAARYLKAQAPLYALSLCAVGALSLALVPRYGLLGAAWASVAGSAVLLLGAAAVNAYAVRRRRATSAPEQPVPDLSADLV
ncbi:MAG: oligosaccharide flippase family protein [Armatimonadota bacterium]